MRWLLGVCVLDSLDEYFGKRSLMIFLDVVCVFGGILGYVTSNC